MIEPEWVVRERVHSEDLAFVGEDMMAGEYTDLAPLQSIADLLLAPS